MVQIHVHVRILGPPVGFDPFEPKAMVPINTHPFNMAKRVNWNGPIYATQIIGWVPLEDGLSMLLNSLVGYLLKMDK